MGMCILDLSNTSTLMYDSYYNYIKNKYGDSAKLLFTDTESLTYEIKTEDVYQDFWNDKGKFDNSDYPKTAHIIRRITRLLVSLKTKHLVLP